MSDSSVQQQQVHEQAAGRPRYGLFFVCALVWVVLDRVTKAYFESSYTLGQVSPDYGPVRFRLVHNTGAAWGMFANSTFALAVLALAVCALIVVLLVLHRRMFGFQASAFETLGLALVFAGGVGNAIDRLAQAFVTDFIEFTFMEFPVFNVADIGVTCGFVILILGYGIASHAYIREVGYDEAADADGRGDAGSRAEVNGRADADGRDEADGRADDGVRAAKGDDADA